jgi:signal transduction histidine kinase/DNA-binding response OmpR family regulator
VRGSRFLSLNLKLALAIIPLILVFMAFNFVVILDHERAILQQETEKRATSMATTLSILSADALSTFNEYQLQQHVVQFARDSDIVSVAILDRQGRVLAHNRSVEGGRVADSDMAQQGRDSSRALLHYGRGEGGRGRILDVYHPIFIKQTRLGTVHLRLSLDSLDRALARSQRYLTGLTLVLLSGAVVFVGFLARWFTQPLLTLAHVARSLSRGQLQTRATVQSMDEVGLLGTALNHMASRLEGMIEREKAARFQLQQRVANLLNFTDRVVAGDLKGQAEAGEDDEMGRLILAVNEMVRHLRIILEDERSVRERLERSRAELEEANEKLKELDQMKSEFLNTVSHELRTPLTAIKAFAEILLDNEGEDQETQVEFLGIINKEADRLTRLINNLLDLSRIEAGRMNWHFEPADLEEVVSAACDTLRLSAEKKGVEYVVEHQAEGGLPVHSDYDKLVQVMTNLVGNALKFTPTGGRVTISSRRVGDKAEVVIAYSGMGIAPEFHAKIFEKFGQVDTSETREIKGSGLGLPIARSIVEAHKGTLTVDSDVGKGARFIVRLPLFGVQLTREAAPAKADAELPPARPGHQRTVLIVDDEASIRRFLRHLLEQEGYDVLEAATGREAIGRCQREQPDLVLLDLRLPDMTGFEILSEFKRVDETSGIPVIILSIIQDRAEGFRLGASDYLTKPVDRDKLMERIQRLIGDQTSLDVLVVEDDPSVQRALQAMLEHHHYKVRPVSSAEEALDQLKEQVPDLILLDLMLPGLSGNDFLKELKEHDDWAPLPVVVLTAADSDQRDEAKLLGAHSVVGKPFSEAELTGLIRSIFEGVGSGTGEATGGSDASALTNMNSADSSG